MSMIASNNDTAFKHTATLYDPLFGVAACTGAVGVVMSNSTAANNILDWVHSLVLPTSTTGTFVYPAISCDTNWTGADSLTWTFDYEGYIEPVHHLNQIRT